MTRHTRVGRVVSGGAGPSSSDTLQIIGRVQDKTADPLLERTTDPRGATSHSHKQNAAHLQDLATAGVSSVRQSSRCTPCLDRSRVGTVLLGARGVRQICRATGFDTAGTPTAPPLGPNGYKYSPPPPLPQCRGTRGQDGARSLGPVAQPSNLLTYHRCTNTLHPLPVLRLVLPPAEGRVDRWALYSPTDLQNRTQNRSARGRALCWNEFRWEEWSELLAMVVSFSRIKEGQLESTNSCRPLPAQGSTPTDRPVSNRVREVSWEGRGGGGR